MAHLHRFYITPDTPVSDTIMLPPDEAHHALRVVRLRTGDMVAVFDGVGHEWIGHITLLPDKQVSVHVEAQREEARPEKQLTLAQAWLNQPKQNEEVIRRGTELGVSHFVFYRGFHSERAPKESEKWERIAIETCKQTGRFWLPTFDTAEEMSGLFEEETDRVLIASLDKETTPLQLALAKHTKVMLIVGPEGDFGLKEQQVALDHGAVPISLGKFTLRSEIAAATACTLIQYEWGQLGGLG